MTVGGLLTAWKLLDAIGNIQTAQDLLRNRGPILQTVGAIVSWPWFGPIVTIVSCALIFWKGRSGELPEASRSPVPPIIDATPQEICGLYEHNTTADANAIFKRTFQGRPIKITGTVDDVDDSSLGLSVTLAEYSGGTAPHVVCIFGRRWESSVRPLRRGRMIALTGVASNANQYTLGLSECELVESAASVVAEVRAAQASVATATPDRSRKKEKQIVQASTKPEPLDLAAASMAANNALGARLKDEIRLEFWAIRHKLHIRVFNNTPNAIRDFRLYVTEMRLYSETHKAFVEVPAMHARGPFKKLELLAEPPITGIFPGHPTLLQFVSIEKTGHTTLLLTFKGRTEDASMETRAIDQGGLWRVDFEISAVGKTGRASLKFRWSPGAAPEPYEDPPVASKAPPPVRDFNA
jgi:hypothetical protein